jgi:hypothetical protein
MPGGSARIRFRGIRERDAPEADLGAEFNDTVPPIAKPPNSAGALMI